MLRIPRQHAPLVSKSVLVAVGSGLITGAPFVPVPWLSGLMFVVGGLLGGKALLKRPGDVKAVQ